MRSERIENGQISGGIGERRPCGASAVAQRAETATRQLSASPGLWRKLENQRRMTRGG